MAELKPGDMLITAVYRDGADEDSTARPDQVARGVYFGDHPDGTIDVAIKEHIVRCFKPSEPILIRDEDLTDVERAWVRGVRRVIANRSFTLPGAEPFARFLREHLYGVLTLGEERLVVHSEDKHGRSWDVLLDGEVIGTYALSLIHISEPTRH